MDKKLMEIIENHILTNNLFMYKMYVNQMLLWPVDFEFIY